jgi:CBS domain-containing protein
MLYRKRAWDIMRGEVPAVSEDATLSRVIEVMLESLTHTPDNDCVLVKGKEGGLAGVITMRNMVQAMGPDLIKKTSGTKKDETNYEKSFRLACQLGAQTGIKKIISKDIPRIRPSDTLVRVIEVFLDYNRSRAVVEEGDKVMGIVLLADVYREIARNI